MRQSLRNIYVTGIYTLILFLSVGYAACSKEEPAAPSTNKCATVQCKNGGSCANGTCTCNAGFEGTTCDIVSIERYLGTWSITEKIVGSSDPLKKSTIRTYKWTIKKKDNINFLIDDIMNNAQYDAVPGEIGLVPSGSGSSRATALNFILRTTAFVSDPDKMQILEGNGTINDGGKYMTGAYVTTYFKDEMPASDTVVFDAVR